MRSAVVIVGLSLLYAALLLLIAKPPAHLAIALPPLTFNQNVPYFLYLRGFETLFGLRTGVIMAANALLVWFTFGALFRTGWGWADARYRFLGGIAALLLFMLQPLALILPLTLGFLGGYLLVPFCMLNFFIVLSVVENWSAFMRAIMFALAWSLFLWVHPPTALLILMAMVPWVLFSRRPLTALGIFLTVFVFGTIVYASLWSLGCLAFHKFQLIQSPLDTVRLLCGYARQGLAMVCSGDPRTYLERGIHLTAWLSPFFLILGLWISGRSLWHMVVERRSQTTDLAALVSLGILVIVLVTTGKDLLPGAWYLLMLGVLWSSLIARRFARTENLYSRGFRLTFGAGFGACAVTLLALQQGSTGLLVPGGWTLVKLVVVVAAVGGFAHGLLKKHPLTLENRAQAFLSGAAIAYFVVMDGLLLR